MVRSLNQSADFYPNWKGKLIIEWPEPAIAWCRVANKPGNAFPVHAVLDESALESGMPKWDRPCSDFGTNSPSCLRSGKPGSRNGEGFITSTTCQSGRVMWARPAARKTFTNDGMGTLRAATAATCCWTETPASSSFRFFNERRQTPNPTKCPGSKFRGKCGCTAVARLA